MSQLKKGAILSYVNIGLSNIIGILLTPFIINSLGKSEYGLYTLLGSFVAYLTLLDLGLNNAIVRYVAKYRAENDKEGEHNFIATTICVYLFIALLIVIIGLVIYSQLNVIFSESLTESELKKGKIMFLILIGNIAITIPGGTFAAICNAYESFIFPRLIKILKYLLRAISIVAILSWGGKALSLVIIDSVLNIFVVFFTSLFVFRKLKIKIDLSRYDNDIVKEIFSYSLWVFLFTIVHQFQWNAGQVILGITTSTSLVAIYGVGILLGGYYNAFGGVINSMLLPKATQLIVQKKNGIEITEIYIKIGRIVIYILSLIISGFFLIGEPFILLWLGIDYTDAWLVALLMMIGMTIPVLQVFGNTILEAKKKNRFKAIISLVSVSIAVSVAFFLTPIYGIKGAIYPIVLAMSLNSVLMSLYFIRIFDFKISHFFNSVLLRPLLVFAPFTLTSYFILDNILINTWFQLMVVVFCYVSIFFSITYLFLMNNFEKSLLKNFYK